jgi:glycerophosphoryl diester phosphodiesterase
MRRGKLLDVALFADPPALCGHRGSGRGIVGGHRENTVESCLAAVEWGLRWLEIDCRLNGEGVLVARHDPRVDDGRFVADLSTAETDELGLVRLEDMFEALPREVGVDLEVKTGLEDALRPREETTAAAASDLAGRAQAAGRPVVLTSFDPSVLMISRERNPELPVGLLTWTRFPLRKAVAAAAHLGVEVVAPHVGSFHPEGHEGPPLDRPPAESVRVAHEAGLQVLAWSPKPDEAAELTAAGVDCLVVDDALAAAARW